MPRSRNTVPTYRLYSSGQAAVTVRLANGNRKEVLLGRHGTASSKAEYRRVCALLEANGGVCQSSQDDLTIAEAMLT